MKVLVVGSGGREHALVWKIAESSLVDKIYAAPGNPGIAKHAECVPITAEDITGLVNFARDNKIDLTVVGPEAPLAKGIVDAFKENKLKIFGPTKDASRLEASKAFCKNLLRKYSILTPDFRIFDQPRSVYRYLDAADYPIVIKADGLCAGKGTFICKSKQEAKNVVKDIMINKIFGKAGEKIICEKYLTGEEVSFFGFVDNKNHILPLEPVQDFKRAYNCDRGPNTGGMGSYSPPVFWTQNMLNEVIEIMANTIYALKKESKPFVGMLYAGLMLSSGKLKVLEFNVRFGDPETQALLVRMKADLLQLILATIEGKLDQVKISWEPGFSVAVVIASKGYPKSPQTGYEITGIEEAEKMEDVVVFHAGTSRKGNAIVNSGGRVLTVSARAPALEKARERAYKAVEKIKFKGAFYRTDIARIQKQDLQTAARTLTN